jgi:hypothetical protein
MRWTTRPLIGAALMGAWALTLVLGASTAQAETKFTTGSADPLISYINEQISTGWTDNEIKPSDVADDMEWLRRVYLDIVGHIPPAEKVEAFARDKDPAKRSKIVEELLSDPAYVRNLTTVWTNVLIGRNTPDRTDRPALEKFLREGFAKNRPWNEMVYDLVSAEGHFTENGAVNFILAQLEGNPNDEEYAVEATARLTRIFLGMQVQCTQCHNHPFNEWKQNQFWEFNSFLRQVRRVDHDKYNPKTGQMDDDYSELAFRDYKGPVYFENRAGLVQVAYPKYMDKDVDQNSEQRRTELASLMTKNDSTKQVAKAMVNRTWGHFFGYGFTKPVDDMGPHNPASHPELLDRLADEFVKSGYDVKQLCRWICNTEAYNLTSQFGSKNAVDNPAAGEVPLFSHMYTKPLQVEQLYDSLIIATNAHQAGSGSYEAAQEQRDRWLTEFKRIFGGAEDSEPTLFSGTIPQALLMMNGPLVKSAISTEDGSLIGTLLKSSPKNETEVIRGMYIASLGRVPTKSETTALKKTMAAYGNYRMEWLQDVYWALLNSNEFVTNH